MFISQKKENYSSYGFPKLEHLAVAEDGKNSRCGEVDDI
jgi:hypothetical protein